MNVGLPEVKQDFASIVERITLQPWTMLQFIIWLDLKMAEYKVNGYMVLDQSLSSIPDWLASLNVDQPKEDNSSSDSVPLHEQYMQPTNTNWRESSMQSNTYQKELSTQSNIIRREVRNQKTFGDRRRDTVARNQPVPARNQPLPARNQPARNQPIPAQNDTISLRRFPSASPQQRRGEGYQRTASPITIDDEEVSATEHNQTLQQEPRNVMDPVRPGMKRAAMQQPPNAPRHDTDIKHRKVTDTSSPVAPARSPSSANVPHGEFGSDNSPNNQATPSSEGVLSRTVNRQAPSVAQSPTQPVQSEQQAQSDIGTVLCRDSSLQDPSLSLDIKPIVSETLDDIISPETTSQTNSDASPLVDINFEMQEFLPAQSIGDELFDSTSSEPVPTQLFQFVNTIESKKPATATSTSATGSNSSANQPDPVAGTSYGTRYQSDFDDSGDAHIKTEPDDTEADQFTQGHSYSSNGSYMEVLADSSRHIALDAQFCKTRTSTSEDNVDVNYQEFKSYTCKKCELTFNDKRRFNTHEFCCGVLDFKCGICGIEFLNKFDRDKHRASVHGDSPRYIYRCPECGKTFYVLSHFDGHMNTHYKRAYNCDKCDAKYAYKFDLIRHRKKRCKFVQCKMINS